MVPDGSAAGQFDRVPARDPPRSRETPQQPGHLCEVHRLPGPHTVPRPAAPPFPSYDALDGIEDTAFWRSINTEGLNGSPLYYPPFLEHKAERCAAVITAIGDAPPGGVLFHCAGGRDRTYLREAGVTTERLAAIRQRSPTRIKI